MNAHQVEAWYGGLGAEREARDGIGARSATLLSGLLNVLLVYAVVQLTVSLPSLDRQRQDGSAGAEPRGGTKRNLKVEPFDAVKAKKDGRR